MKTTRDIIEEVVMGHLYWREIERETEIEELEGEVKIIIKTKTHETTIFSKVCPNEEDLDKIRKEITEEYRIPIILESGRNEIRIVVNEREKLWEESCLS